MPAGQAPASAGAVLGRLSSTYLWCAVVLMALGASNLFGRAWAISDLYFARHDVFGLLAAALALVVVARKRLGVDLEVRSPHSPAAIAAALAIACAAVAWAGTFGVFQGFALSMDEFWARFDAASFARGRLFGELPGSWAGYKTALEPMWQMGTPSPVHWSSSYLPVNALARAAGRLIGLESLVNPLWTALAVFMTWAAGRRLWPDRPQAALAAAVLTATSSQVLVTGMTAYAMPAHLALNMVWLWGFVRGGRTGHAIALLAGFAATGLHQLVFHPLFAAPFVLQLWLDRRWRLAALYTAAYALIGLFWASWWNLAFAVMDFGHPVTRMSAGGLADRVLALIDKREIGDVALMARNLARFVAWQNPFATGLTVLGAVAAVSARGAPRTLLLSIVLTAVVVAVILPFQGHGWGYRYLHGAVGSMCLLAAWTWSRLLDGLDGVERREMDHAFTTVAILSVLVALPFNAWQARSFVAPYARINAAIAHADADVALIDDRGIWYGLDLIRNDPFMRSRPAVLWLRGLSPAQTEAVCKRGKVVMVGKESAQAFGLRLVATTERGGGGRAPPLPPGCGANPLRPSRS